jgi:YhcH/YjgK/YiaL family protein
MIKNSLKYTKNYYNLSEKIKIALEYLEKNSLKQVQNGKYEILGEDVFINVQDYTSKPENQGKWEAHRKYIDIQFIIKGSEKIGVGEIQDFSTVEIYNSENDVEFLETSEPQQFITMKENDYIILYPYDVHMPQISINSPTYVKKAVIKISV